MNKLLIICGPTATGKTDLGIILAKKFNGEIISADSRQVYKGLDVITGKDVDPNSKFINQNSELKISRKDISVGFRQKADIPVWLIDIVEPTYPFNAGEYAVFAQKVISNIWERGKLPIVVGGTGFYIRSIIDPYTSNMIPPNKMLRNTLERQSLINLQEKLQKEDSVRWINMNESDRKNPRRLIRAIEVAQWNNTYSLQFSGLKTILTENILMIGLNTDKNTMQDRINQRVIKRMEQGAIDEVKKLMNIQNISYLPFFTATGAFEITKFLDNQQSLSETIHSWIIREIEYVKRQLTFFRKIEKIKWFDISDSNFIQQIENDVKRWYTSDNAKS